MVDEIWESLLNFHMPPQWNYHIKESDPLALQPSFCTSASPAYTWRDSFYQKTIYVCTSNLN